MREIGIVTETVDDFAKVRVIRKSACGENCAQCGGCTPSATTVNAKNAVGAHSGDRVVLEIEDKKAMRAAVYAYILPLAALFAGAVISYIFGASDGICALCGLAAMLICFFAVKKRLLKSGKDFEVNIKSIIE